MKDVNGVSVFSDLAEILAPEHTALIVVDMQNDFCQPDGWMAQNGRDIDPIRGIIPRVGQLIDAARHTGAQVIFIQQTTLPGNASDPPAWLYFKTRDGRKGTDYTIDGSWGHEILAELEPRPSELHISKFRPSAFHMTPLDLVLTGNGVASVVIAGVITQGCILATALDASFHNYYTVVVDDAVQSFNQEQHAFAISFLRSRYDVVSADTVVNEGCWR